MYKGQSETSSLNTKRRGIGRHILDRGYEARLALDANAKRDAYALRYRSYHSQGFIPANATGLFTDQFDEMFNTRTVVVYAEGAAVGSVRTCLLRRGEGNLSPARQAYPSEIEHLLVNSGPEREGWDGLEVNRMVRAPEAVDDQGLVFMLYRLAGRLAISARFRVVVSCARRNHLPFYRRMRFTQAGEAKTYPGLSCPMVLLQSSRSEWDMMREGFPLMDPEAGPPGLLDGLEAGETVYPYLVRRV